MRYYNIYCIQYEKIFKIKLYIKSHHTFWDALWSILVSSTVHLRTFRHLGPEATLEAALAAVLEAKLEAFILSIKKRVGFAIMIF
jgi:hypothetical protein